MVDVGFLLAVGAFGWGLSLASYRGLAVRRGWPMGVLAGGLAGHADGARASCAS